MSWEPDAPTPDHHNAMLAAVSSQTVAPSLSAADIESLIRSGEAAILALKAYQKSCNQLRFIAAGQLE